MSRSPISAAYLERKLRALAGLSGSLALATLDDLRGFVQLEVDRPEWRLAAGDRLTYWAAQQAQAVGEFAYIGLRNPVDSGVLAVVELTRTTQSTSAGATNGVVAFQQASPFDAADVVNPARNLDLRDANNFGGLASYATQVIQGTQAVQGMGSNLLWLLSGHPGNANGDELRYPFIVPPGIQVVWFSNIANTLIALYMRGYERPIEGRFDLR